MPSTARTTERNRRVKNRPSTSLKKTEPPLPMMGRSGFRTNLALCVLLGLFTLVVYGRVGGHRFLEYDDQDYVTKNAHVQAGLTWETLTWALTSTDASNWHPLTWVSHALDSELFGLNPAGHHWTSVVIHAFNAMLLFLLLQAVTGTRWRSLLVAALFALHPLNVESVAWVAERKNVLSTLFFLLALRAYGWYSRKPNVGRYLTMALLFVLALASKPMAITFPFVLLLLDFWPLQRILGTNDPSAVFPAQQASLRQLVVEKLPLFALSAGSAIITIVAQKESLIPSHSLPFGVRLETSLYAYGMYLWKMIWPAKLALVYPHPGRTLDLWKPALSALLIVVASVGVWKQRSTRPYLLIGWLWFLGTALPIIGIMQVGVQVIADRYAYVPLIGLFVAFTWGLSSVADRFSVSTAARWVAACLLMAALSVATWQQIGFWKDDFSVWNHAVAVTKDNSIAENFLANTLFELGRYQEGMAHLRTYASLEPLDPLAHAKVAADLEDHGHMVEAAKEYETAVHGSSVLLRNGLPGLAPPALAITYVNLGRVYSDMGDDKKAAEATRMGLSIDTGAVTDMLRQFAQSLAAHPTAEGYVRLAKLLNQVGDLPEAQQALAQAQRLQGSQSAAHGASPAQKSP